MSGNNFDRGEGVVKRHTKDQYKSINAATFTVLQWIYIDDGAFNFESIEQLKRYVQVIHDNFSHLIIDMHIGK